MSSGTEDLPVRPWLAPFLAELSRTGSVAASARHAGIHPRTVSGLARMSPPLRAAIDTALRQARRRNAPRPTHDLDPAPWVGLAQGWARRQARLRPHADWEDAALWALYRAWVTYRPDRGGFPQWLLWHFRSVRKTVLTTLRRHPDRRPADLDAVLDGRGIVRHW